MIPVGPKSIAFMPGTIEHTNQIYCPLGQNYFALCSASHARNILNRKILCLFFFFLFFLFLINLLIWSFYFHYLSSLDVVEQLNNVENELQGLCARLTADEISNTEEHIEKVGDAELVKHGDFIEIRELETVEEALEKASKQSISSKDSNVDHDKQKLERDAEMDDIMEMWSKLETQENDDRVKLVSSSSVDDPSDIFQMNIPPTPKSGNSESSSSSSKEKELKSCLKSKYYFKKWNL